MHLSNKRQYVSTSDDTRGMRQLKGGLFEEDSLRFGGTTIGFTMVPLISTINDATSFLLSFHVHMKERLQPPIKDDSIHMSIIFGSKMHSHLLNQINTFN